MGDRCGAAPDDVLDRGSRVSRVTCRRSCRREATTACSATARRNATGRPYTDSDRRRAARRRSPSIALRTASGSCPRDWLSCSRPSFAWTSSSGSCHRLGDPARTLGTPTREPRQHAEASSTQSSAGGIEPVNTPGDSSRPLSHRHPIFFQAIRPSRPCAAPRRASAALQRLAAARTVARPRRSPVRAYLPRPAPTQPRSIPRDAMLPTPRMPTWGPGFSTPLAPSRSSAASRSRPLSHHPSQLADSPCSHVAVDAAGTEEHHRSA